MFKSKLRSITIPQSEHARLSGHLAYFWGNAVVDKPPVDQFSFATGVTLHDRGYGPIDTMAIGEVEADVWLATQRRGIQMPHTDAIADTVALLHIQRLLTHSDQAGAPALIAMAEERIADNVSHTTYQREAFAQADTITHLCDSISFKFCFEEPGQFTQSVVSKGEMQPIQVQIGQAGQIHLRPWPLSVPELRGFILGYHFASYPDHLQPVLVEFAITP